MRWGGVGNPLGLGCLSGCGPRFFPTEPMRDRAPTGAHRNDGPGGPVWRTPASVMPDAATARSSSPYGIQGDAERSRRPGDPGHGLAPVAAAPPHDASGPETHHESPPLPHRTAATAALVSTTSIALPVRSAEGDRPSYDPAEIDELKAVSLDIDLVVCRTEAEAIEQARAPHPLRLHLPGRIRAGQSLRWVQQPSAGVEGLMEIPELVKGDIILTNMQRVYAPRSPIRRSATCSPSPGAWRISSGDSPPRSGITRAGRGLDELMGKTLLVIGLGGIGTEIARRAHAFGMRVLATDPKVLERPLYVDELARPDAFHDLLPRADVVVSAVPLTRQSRGMIAAREFAMMKRGVILINVSRGKVVDTDALIAALDSGEVAAAGLDVTDPEPLPKGHPLWSRNATSRATGAGQSPGGERRRHELFRENLRRFAAGEMLLNVVDKRVGY